jgi:hypothetical protein
VPRTNDGQELWRKLDSLTAYRILTAGGSSTVATTITAGQQTYSVGAVTNWSSGDYAIFSGTEGVWLDSLASASSPNLVTLWKAPIAATATGASVYEATASVIGHLQEEGITLSPAFDQTPIYSAIRDLPLQYLPGRGEISASAGLLGFNVLNWQLAVGATESEQGTGTSSDPYQGYVGGNTFGTQTTQVLRFQGTRFDGKTVVVDLNDARAQANGSVNFNRQNPAAIPVTFKFSGMTIRIYT